MIKGYEKTLTPTRVKAKERGDVDIDRLVKHGLHRLVAPQPVYADLSELPRSRGEAAQLLIETLSGIDPALSAAILKLPPDQALQAISSLRPPASNANDKTNAKEQGPSTTPQNGPGTLAAPPAAAK